MDWTCLVDWPGSSIAHMFLLKIAMYSRRVCLAFAIAAVWLLVAAGNAIAQPKYVVTLGNMVAWRIVSNRSDTDYISLSVQGPNGQKFSKTYGPNRLRQNQTTDWAQSSTPIIVPTDSKSTLTISWAAVNAGNTSIEKIGKVLADTGEAIGQGSGDPYAIVLSTVFGAIGGYLLQNCDAPLFAGRVTFTGAQLVAGQLGGQWSSEGADRWHAVFDYLDIPRSCHTGRYNLEVHIQKQQ
jgi:hypothetical protein